MTRKQIGAVLGAAVLAVAAFLLALVLLHGLDGTTQAQGSLVVGIDMVPGWTPPNDAYTVGSVEGCIMTSPGSSETFDVYLDEVPATSNFYYWQADIGYDDTNLTVISQGHTIPGLNLITRTGASAYIDMSESVPDPPGGGPPGIHRVNVSPVLGSGVPGPAEGVLGRYSVSVSQYAPPGLYSLSLSNVTILDDGGAEVPWDELRGAWLAVDVPCGYEKVSMPDFGQHSSSWCWVAAAANSLWWYGENVEGEEGLLGGPGKPWKAIDPLSRNALGPDTRDPHDLDADTIINESDGFPDWFDYNDRPEQWGVPRDGTCGNTLDDNWDTVADWPADPLCWFGVDLDGDTVIDEDPVQAGLDDDGDGLVDEDGPEDANADTTPDGVDNDGDTRVDEDPPGFDDDGSGSEGPAGPGSCADGCDNNANTLVDCADPSCAPNCDEDGIVGYRQLLREIADATWHDTNLNGTQEINGVDGTPNTPDDEPTYVYSEAVEKWDYLLGLKNFVDTYGSNLVVHDIIDPAKCGIGTGFLANRTTPTLNALPACGVPGIDQEQRVPTLADYQQELSRSQDVLLWMEPLGGYPEYSHVVTGVAFGLGVDLGTITVSDPWTHAATPPHDDSWLLWVPMSPDHNNAVGHDPSPYEVCDVLSTGEWGTPFTIACPDAEWQVVDLIFISPAVADLEKLELYVKPFYCGDSDMDGDEATGAHVTPGTGTCCDNVDNDGNTLTDGQDPKCFTPMGVGPLPTYINEEWPDGFDADGDSLIDEDPLFYPSAQTCPWNGDDDCDGTAANTWCDAIYLLPYGIGVGTPQYCVDEDPKNDIDDDGDGSEGGAALGTCKDGYDNNGDTLVDCADPTCAPKCDEDPANGFLGLDNDGDGAVDEDGAGSFDWDGDTTIDTVQLEGVDDDGDGLVDEDPLDSPLPVSTPAEGAPTIKWAQPPDDTPLGLDVNAGTPFSYVLANDFQCTETGYITEVDFWGSWYQDYLPLGDPQAVQFTLSIHPDVPASGEPPWSHPGDMLWTYTFDPGTCTAALFNPVVEEGWLNPPNLYQPFGDTQIWFYQCSIPEGEWFRQEQGNIYWLDLQAIPMDPEAWFGWKTVPPGAQWNDDAVWTVGQEPIDPGTWQELHYPPGHDMVGQSIDLALQIWGVPETTRIHEPHYLVKERLVNNGPDAVTAIQNEMLNAPAARVDALEDGRTTCNDLWDNDGDTAVDAADPLCLDPGALEESFNVHSCNDGLDNGLLLGQPPDGADDGDADCATLTEVSVECKEPSDVIDVSPGVTYYIKPPSNDPILLSYPGCAQYYDDAHFNKCVPCKIPMGTGPIHLPCETLVSGPGYCIAADSLPGLDWQELYLSQQVELPVDEPVVTEDQSDLTCEGETSLHKFTFVGEVYPATGYENDPNPDNNAMGMDMLVACTQWAWGQVNNLSVPLYDDGGTTWDVLATHSESTTVQADVTNASSYAADFVLALQEESPAIASLVDSDGDTWVDRVEHILLSSAEKTIPENGGESEAIGAGFCTDTIDNDGDTFVDAADAGCRTPESVHAQGTCNDGIDNNKNGYPDAADPWCQDIDLDGYSDAEEAYLFHSDPFDPTKTPEYAQFPWTCNDGIDNDGDGSCDDAGGCGPGMPAEGDDNVDGKADCSASELGTIEPPVTCASGWAREDLNLDALPDGTDREYVYLANDGTVTVGLDIPVPGLVGGPLTVSRNLVLDCFWSATPYAPETVRATIRPADVHQMDLNPADDELFTTFDGDATCNPAYPDADLTVDSWTFNYTPDPNFHVGEELPVHAVKVIHNSGPGSPVDVVEQKALNIPEGCDFSLHIDHGESVHISDDVYYNVGGGFDAAFPGAWSQGPITLSPPAGTVYLRGLTAAQDPTGNVNEVDAWFTITGVSSSPETVDEYFDIHCREAGSYDYKFHNQITPAEYPDRCDPTTDDITWDETVHVDVAPDADADTWPDGVDNCPDKANPDQLNTDGDLWGDVCDLDDDNDGYRDADEDSKGSDDLIAAQTPEHCDAPVDNDGDTLVDEGFPDTNPGGFMDCLDALVDTDGDTDVNTIDPNDDSDPAVWNDGFTDAAERYMTTDELDACPELPGDPLYNNPWGAPKDDAWPPDIDMNRVVDVTDAGLFLAAYPSAVGGGVGSYYYTRRLDMALQNGLIDVNDAGVFLSFFPGACALP